MLVASFVEIVSLIAFFGLYLLIETPMAVVHYSDWIVALTRLSGKILSQ